MSIPFSCECGKRLHAKDQFAGRRLKCPKCARVITIPRHASELSAAATTAQAGPRSRAARTMTSPVAAALPKAGFVRFVCSCGRKMRARTGDAGSSIDCPTCGRELTIPKRDTDVPPEPKFGPIPVTTPKTSKQLSAPRTARQVASPATSPQLKAPAMTVLANPRAANGLFSQSVTPWRDDELRRLSGPEPKEKPVRRLWRPFLGMLVLVGVVCAFGFLAPHESTSATGEVRPSDLNLVPPNASTVVSMRVSHLSNPAKNIQNPLLQFSESLYRPVLWGASDLSRITIVTLAQPQLAVPIGGKVQPEATPVVYIMRTVRPYSQGDVRSRMLSAAALPERIGKRTVFADSKSGKVLLFVDPNVFVLGTQASIRHVLFAGVLEEGKKHPLQAALDAAVQHDFVMGVNLDWRSAKERPFRSQIAWVDESYEEKVLHLMLHRETVFDRKEQAEQEKLALETYKHTKDLKFISENIGVIGTQLTVDVYAADPQASELWADVRRLADMLHPVPWVPDPNPPKMQDDKGKGKGKGKGKIG
jgi:DNA-directed RNA polymerase subunit M/transcription elongation factor TFIIS